MSKSIPQLNEKTSAVDDDLFHLVRANVDYKIKKQNLLSSISGYVDITKAALDVLYAAKTLSGNYRITNSSQADSGIYIKSVNTEGFELECIGGYLNPDYNNTGTLTVLGIWVAATAYLIGDIVIWDGLHYEASANNTGFQPDSNPAKWTTLAKSVANGYIQEYDFIYYDFVSNDAFFRADDRGNMITDWWGAFQFGNDSVTRNVSLEGGVFYCINSRGGITYNILQNPLTINLDNTHAGSVSGNIFAGGQAITVNMNAGKTLSGCYINPIEDITLDPAETQQKKVIQGGYSTFTHDANMSTLFAAGVLTLTSSWNYVGIFNLINNTGQTITSIVNMPTTHTVEFIVANGNTQSFSHTAIAGAAANNLISDSAAVNAIVGRTNGGDWIQYRRKGTMNDRYNISIKA